MWGLGRATSLATRLGRHTKVPMKPGQLDRIDRKARFIDVRVRQLKRHIAERTSQLISICNGPRVIHNDRKIDEIDLITRPDGSDLLDSVEVSKKEARRWCRYQVDQVPRTTVSGTCCLSLPQN